jgi:AraC-like DNA-binding protein
MMVRRQPRPELRAFVKTLWATDPSDSPTVPTASRERVLPTGEMHLAFRFNSPLRLFRNIDDAAGYTVGQAVVGGARASFCVKDISDPSSSVGVQLSAGAAEMLFGMPADELAERHTLLSDLWGSIATSILDQLQHAHTPEQRLDLLESILISRVPAVRRLHPAVAHALTRFTVAGSINEIVKETGYSHRRFIALFRREVGLPPKAFTRILRFQHAINRVASDPSAEWADLALAAGYSDQSHFNREFREFAGVTPEEYWTISPLSANHLPIGQFCSRRRRES